MVVIIAVIVYLVFVIPLYYKIEGSPENCAFSPSDIIVGRCHR